MNLDIRLPIGLMFSTIGALLTVYGIFTLDNAEMYQKTLGLNINLWWGLTMLIFGSLMTIAAIKSIRRKKG